MNARVWLAGLLMAVLPSIVLAQGRIAVVNLEQAILQTDVAQQRLQEFESNEDFASDKSQFDALREGARSTGQGFSTRPSGHERGRPGCSATKDGEQAV